MLAAAGKDARFPAPRTSCAPPAAPRSASSSSPTWASSTSTGELDPDLRGRQQRHLIADKDIITIVHAEYALDD